MDCSALDVSEQHAALALVTAIVGRSKWASAGADMVARDALVDLEEDGWIERVAEGRYRPVVRCNCSYLRVAKASLRALSDTSSEQRGLPQQSPRRVVNLRSHVATQVVSNEEDGCVPCVEAKPSTRTHTPLRSRGGGAKQSEGLPSIRTVGSPGELAGKTISGSRKTTEVVARYQRRNSPTSWQDRPVEKWNSTHLAGYFDAMSWKKCRGLSLDRYHMKNVTQNMARLRQEGASNQDIKNMVDVYLDRVSSSDARVPSLWKAFFAGVPRLRGLLTSNATGHYNNQPTTSHDDEDYL